MVFVTGATGLIGSYLLLELSKREKKIRALKRKNADLTGVKNLFSEFSDLETFEKIEWIEADLLDIPSLENSFQGIKTIFHTAGCVGFDDREKEMIHQINVEGTENLINLALSEKVPEFVFTSSIAVLDELPDKTIIDENSKFDAEKVHSEYAISKKKAEMAVWRGSQEGLNVIVVHPSVVVGSLDGKRASEKIFKLATKKKMFATKGITGYVDVRDVAFCLIELTEHKKWNDHFILTSESKSFFEIFRYLRAKENLHEPVLLSEMKLKWIKGISQFSRLFGGPYMSGSSYQALTGKAKYSNERIRNEIGIKLIPVNESLDFHFERYKKMMNSSN